MGRRGDFDMVGVSPHHQSIARKIMPPLLSKGRAGEGLFQNATVTIY
jgi:hypothetical protein